jgi:putative acetyltransferase
MTSPSITIRAFQPGDAPSIAQLFHETVRTINCHDYSQAQVQAWAPDDLNFRNWAVVCSSRSTFVAETEAQMIVGFAELEQNGHIDCFYCHKQFQRCGVGQHLYQAIEAKALEIGVSRLFSEVSITAQPFFLRMGFSNIKAQTVTCRGENFLNYRMEKAI